MNIKDFLPTYNPFISIIGSRGKGKSYLTKKIIKELKDDYDHIIVLCPTAKLNNDYKEFLPKKPDKVKHNKFNVFHKTSDFKKIVEELMNDNSDIVIKDGIENTPNIMLILDDCVHLKLFSNKGIIEELATNGRHYKITVIILSQYLKAISAKIRSNSDLIVLFSVNSRAEEEKLLDDYFYSNEKKDMREYFKQYFKKPYNYIVIKNGLNNGIYEGFDINKKIEF